MREEERKHSAQHKVGTLPWTKPPEGWIKINIDAACGQGTGGMGCVVRDDFGDFIRARCNVTTQKMQPREAEALSLREALSRLKDWRNGRCIFESDAKLLVDAINGTRGRSYFDTIVIDCLELLKHFEEVLVVFVHKSANNVAHMLARVACSMSGPQEWLYTAPDINDCNIASEKY